MTYKLLANSSGVQRVEDGAFIPATTDNRDWIAYQAFLAAGGKPLPADPLPPLPPKTLNDGKLAAVLLAKGVVSQADIDAALAVP